ncbi:Zinc finger-containing ubiquitin peptidase 1 [Bulinus truncatus]|nr:Zinc finger-containing ubiquitin peptidase 1 [Bulinus truncatus]
MQQPVTSEASLTFTSRLWLILVRTPKENAQDNNLCLSSLNLKSFWLHFVIIVIEVAGDPPWAALSCQPSAASAYFTKGDKEAHNTEATVYGVSSSHEMSSEMTCPVCGLSMTDPDLLISHVESHFNPKHSRDSDFSHSKVDTNIVPYKSSPKDIRAEETAGSKNNLTEKNLCHDSSDTSNVNHVNVNNLSSKDNIDPSSSRDNIEPSISKASFRASASKENSTYKRMYEQNLQKAVMRGQISVPEYHEQIRSMKQNDLKGVDDGSTRVSGLIQKLESVYRSQARPGQSAILCYPTDHYFASFGDKGWGCGYHNFQMILSCLSLLPDFAAKLFPDQQRHIPSIPKIQEMIESAWRRGFDPQGCLQLNGKLINTKKWIGATEIIATLSSLGIKCHLADFHTPSSHDGTHPRLLEWVSDHFRKCQSQGLCKAPLYLQHQGHSRTIIGVENDKGVTKLLLFDPGTPKDQLMDLAGGRLCWKDLRAFRRTQAGFRAKQYQIVAVVGLLSKHEFEESKILKSERVS